MTSFLGKVTYSVFCAKKSMKRAALQQKWKTSASKRTKTPYVRGSTASSSARSLNKAEMKAFDTALSFNFDLTGEVPATGQLCLVQAGDAFNNRDGALIQVKSLRVKGLATAVNGAGANGNQQCKLMIVQDRQCNGAAAAVTDVMTGVGLLTDLPNVPNSYRFKVLRDLTLDMNATAGVTAAYLNNTKEIDEYVSFKKPIWIRYTASTGAITDVTGNNLFLLASCFPGDDIVSFVGTARIRFTG